jgi:hypothetical protein
MDRDNEPFLAEPEWHKLAKSVLGTGTQNRR